MFLLAGCAVPGTDPQPTSPALASSATPAPTTAVVDTAGVIATGMAAFPMVPGGTSFYDCGYDGNLAKCPITDRLLARLVSAQITLCSCNQPSPDRVVTAEVKGGRGIAHVQLYGGLLKLDLVVLPVATRLLVDDEMLTGGGPEASIYASPVQKPEPTTPDEGGTDVKPGGPPPQVYTTLVPVLAQLMNLDCETAALQMALSAAGHEYTQAALFALENPDTRPAVLAADGSILQWGDPYTNFVGLVDGLESNATGYGVYYPVILAIARSHGVPGAIGGDGLSARAIYAALQAGYPVQVWVETNWVRPRVGTWTAWDGRSIPYSLHEHSVTLSGESADSVRVNDPLHGTQYWISKATFEVSWRDFGNQAIIFK
ncbi:MAG TPA: C39 family peptidase [Candidatus Dormibacteraeota bacterium]